MPTKAPQRKFRVELQSQTNEQRRSVTVTRVPCPKCLNDPLARGGYEMANGHRFPECSECNGRGDVPATADSAAAFVEEMEKEFAAFRLDEAATIARYPALDFDSLERVLETTKLYPKDEYTVDNRFMRAGKVRPSGAPGYTTQHRGWRGFHEQEEPYKVMRVGDTSLVAAVTGYAWPVPLRDMFDGTAVWDFNTDTIKTSLHSALDQATNFDTYDRFNDVSGTEVTGTNYTAGGATLASPTVLYDTGTDQIRSDGADTTWATSTISATDSVTYKSTGTASTSPLITSLDFGATVSTTAGTFQITWDATGIHVIDAT